MKNEGKGGDYLEERGYVLKSPKIFVGCGWIFEREGLKQFGLDEEKVRSEAGVRLWMDGWRGMEVFNNYGGGWHVARCLHVCVARGIVERGTAS